MRSLVSNMVAAGLNRVVGMADWDTKNSSSSDGRLHILCEGERYAIENLLLDPVLCIRLMCKLQMDAAVNEGYLQDGEGERSLDRWKVEKWQDMIDRFCAAVLPEADQSQKTVIEYMNGKEFGIPSSFLATKGHNLQDMIVARYPCFRAYNGQGNLLFTIAKHISIGDYDKWYPKSIVATMDALTALAITDD